MRLLFFYEKLKILFDSRNGFVTFEAIKFTR